jgi:hypothetical protein
MADTLKQKLAARKAEREASTKARVEANKKVKLPNTNEVKNSIPDDQKPQGISLLSNLVVNQAINLGTRMLPTIQNIAEKELGIDLTMDSKDYLCPANVQNTQAVLDKFNNYTDDLNGALDSLDKIKTFVNSTQPIINGVETSVNTINVVTPLLITAISAFPPLTLPGAVVSAVDTIDVVRQQLLFKEDGTPRLPELKGAVNAVGASLTVASIPLNSIKEVVDKLNSFFKKCLPNATINEVSPSINGLTQNTQVAEQVGGSVYSGFLIEILTEEDNQFRATRRKAVGKNSNGIILIETPYTFSDNDQVLINQLKFIIDRDNLKAY